MLRNGGGRIILSTLITKFEQKIMLRFFLVCLLFGSFAFSSCDYVPAKKKQMIYDKISGTNDTVDKMTREWYRQLSLSLKDRNFSRLSQYRIAKAEFLSSHRSAIANLRIDAAATNLLDSEEVYLSNQAAAVNDVYTLFEAYNEMTPPDVINAQLQKIAYDQGTEITWNAAMKRSLLAYGRKDKLKMKK